MNKMAEETKTKRTKKTKTEDKDTNTKVPKGSKNRVVWLFGAHDKVARHAGVQFFNPKHDLYTNLRARLGLKLDALVIPIFPEMHKRLELVGYFAEANFPLKDPTILVIGQHQDFQNKKVPEFKGQEYLFYHPGERDYSLQSGEAYPGVYAKVTKRKEDMEKTLSQIFTPVE